VKARFLHSMHELRMTVAVENGRDGYFADLSVYDVGNVISLKVQLTW